MTKTDLRDVQRKPWTSGENATVWAMIAAHTLVFTVLSYLRYRSFFAYEWQDLAVANQIAYHTGRGALFYQSITEQFFLGHIQPIYLLVAIPHLIWPHVTTLQFVMSLAWAMAALPIYWLAQARLAARRAGVLCAWVYLCYAPLNYVNLFEFRPVLLAPPILVFAVYFLERNRYWPFLTACFLALCCKENVALSVILIGLYGLYRRRRLRWAIPPVAVAGLWLVLSIACVVPVCLRNVRYPHEVGPYFQQWGGGHGLWDFVKSSLLDPLPRLRLMFCHHRLLLLFRLLWPLCFLPLLSPVVLALGLPGLLQIMLARNSYFVNSRAHWLGAPVAFFALAAIFSVLKVSDWCAKRGLAKGVRARAEWLVLAVLCITSFASNLTHNILGVPASAHPIHDTRFLTVTNMYDQRFYRMEDEDRRAWEVLSQIPGDASVAASGHLMPALSSRPKVVEFGLPLFYTSGRQRDYTDVDYIVIHARSLYHGGGNCWGQGRRVLRDEIEQLLRAGGWSIVKLEGQFLVLKRTAGQQLSPDEIAATARRLRTEWAKGRGAAFGDLIDEIDFLLARGDDDAAEPLLREAVSLKPVDAFAYRRLGLIEMAKNNYKEAVALLSQAAAISPFSCITRSELAMAYQGLGDLVSAEQEFRRAIWLFPNEAVFHDGLGDVLWQQGQRQRALRAWHRALKLDPDSIDTRRSITHGLDELSRSPER